MAASITFRAVPAALALATALCGCGDGEGAPADVRQQPGPLSNGMPPIYVDLVEEELYKGENSEKRNYRGHLKLCQEAGFPTTPLSAKQIEPLGTTRLQHWLEQGRDIMRSETWTFRFGEEGIGTCHFRLVRTANQSYDDALTSSVTDLETGEVTSNTPAAHIVERLAIEYDGSLEEIAAKDQLAPPTTRTVAGAECTQWTDPKFFGRTICLWSAGRAWGFDDTGAESGCGTNHKNRIVLSEEPLSGSGCRITTRRFSVGQPISPDAYQIPPATGAGQ